MAFDVAELNKLVAAVSGAEDTLATAATANTQAQADAQAASAKAAQAQATQDTAHKALSDAVDALVAYANSLK